MCVRKGGSRTEVLEDVECSWSETWRTGSSLISWMMFFTLRKIPWKLAVDISIRSVSGMGVQEGAYLEDVEGFWLETYRTGSFLMSGMMFFTQSKIPWKFCVDILIRSVSGIGGQEDIGGHLRFLIRYLEDRVILDVMEDVFFILKNIPQKFCVYIFIRSVSRRGIQEGWYLVDIEGSWSKTLRTWLSLRRSSTHWV